MRLRSASGASVQLRPVGYEFPAATASGRQNWDANWLVIAGDVETAEGRSWSFSDPCLTTWEAKSLASWLRAVVAGRVEPATLGDDDELVEEFMEPTLALSLASRSPSSVVVRLHLCAEAAPPWRDDDSPDDDFVVSLNLSFDELSAAADEWDRELAVFPER